MTGETGLDDSGVAAVAERHATYRLVIWAAALVLGVLVLTLPLSQVARMVESLAGEDTAIDVSLALQVTIALSLGMALGWGVTVRVVWRQKKDLKRLRKRVDELEQQLGARGI